MAVTYDSLSTTTLSSAAASVTFSSISQAYTDLVLVMYAQSTQATTYDNLNIRFNSDSASNYSRIRFNGSSGGAGTDSSSNATSFGIGAITGTSYASTVFSMSITNIQNYSNSTTYKAVISRNNVQDAYVQAGVGSWRSTSAITSITILTASGSNLAAGCSFALYGIAAA